MMRQNGDKGVPGHAMGTRTTMARKSMYWVYGCEEGAIMDA